MQLNSNRLRPLLAIAAAFFLATAMPATAQEISGAVRTIAEGEDLIAISGGDAELALAIRIVNDIQNPYELKSGAKIIIPDAAVVKEIAAMTPDELIEKAESVRDRISSTLRAELDRSFADQVSAMPPLPELPKPTDVNLAFFQGMMPAFRPMYGFIGAAMDEGLAALGETWGSQSPNASGAINTSMGNLPQSAKRMYAPEGGATLSAADISKSGALPGTKKSSRSSTRTTKTGSGVTDGAIGGTAGKNTPAYTNKIDQYKKALAEAQAKSNSKDIASAVAKAAATVKKGAAAVGSAAAKGASKGGGHGNADEEIQRKQSNASASISAADAREVQQKKNIVNASRTSSTSSKSSSSSSSNFDSVVGAAVGGSLGMLAGGIPGAAAGAYAGAKNATKIKNVAKKVWSKINPFD